MSADISTTRDHGGTMRSSAPSKVPSGTNPLEWILGRKSTLGSTLFLTGLIVGSVLVFWQLSGLRVEVYSSPRDIAMAFVNHTELIARSTWASSVRVGVSLLFAGCVAYPLGILLATYFRFSGALNALLGFLFAFPKLAVVLFYVFLVGAAKGSMLVPLMWTSGVIGLSLGFLSARRLMDNQNAGARDLIDAMSQYCGSRWQLYRTQFLPLLAPEMFQSLQIISATLWPILIFIEPSVQYRADGLGSLVFVSVGLGRFNADMFFAASIVIAFMNALTWALMKQLERLARWRIYGA